MDKSAIASTPSHGNAVIPFDNVKLCGYLKTKRDKVGGGWRRLWFVLRDHLLVSYSSKEAYDNKLVSFKDVVYLVPGTQVRPLDGFRFTIETATQNVYKFHCDNGDEYRDWITMLLKNVVTPTVVKQRHFRMESASQTLSAFSANTPAIRDLSANLLSLSLQKLNEDESQFVKKETKQMSLKGSKELRHGFLLSSGDAVKQNRMFFSEIKIKSNEQNDLYRLPNEPVYAVVDLKNKHCQRELRCSKIGSIESRRSNSYESIFQTKFDKKRSLESLPESIYEDGDFLINDKDNYQCIKICNTEATNSKKDEENIYEPINIGHQSYRHLLRKYMSYLKINPFARRRFYADIKIPAHIEGPNMPNRSRPKFLIMRWKFGNRHK